MSGYTVTITTHGAQAGSQTTIAVDTATGSPRITELTVRPADGTGLSPEQLPLVDLPALILALTPPTTQAIAAAPAAEPAAAIEPAPATRARGTRGRPAKAAASTPTTRGARGRRGAAEERATPARGRRRAAPAEVSSESSSSGRAYRRMPEQDQVVAAYQQAGSVTAVAEHFGVPRHTATGWLRRLRSLGVLESKSSASS